MGGGRYDKLVATSAVQILSAAGLLDHRSFELERLGANRVLAR